NFQLSDEKKLNLDNNIHSSNINNSLHSTREYQIIQNFDKINLKEIEPTTQYIHESISEEDLSIVIDELVNLYLKDLNKGKEENVRKKHILDCINNNK